MSEIKILIEVIPDIVEKVIINQENANELNVKNGVLVEIINPENNLSKILPVEISEFLLSGSGRISEISANTIQFTGKKLIIRNPKQISDSTSKTPRGKVNIQKISSLKIGMVILNLILILVLSWIIHNIRYGAGTMGEETIWAINILLALLIILPTFKVFEKIKGASIVCGVLIFFIILIVSSLSHITIFHFYFQLILIFPIFIWMHIANHMIINGISAGTSSYNKLLYVVKYKPKTNEMESLVVILAFIYLFGFLIMFLLGEYFRWEPLMNGTGRIIMALTALNFFWYATKYSRTVIYLAIIMGNLLLTISIFVNFSILLEYNLILNLIISNIGLLLLGGPIVACKKDDPLRRILIFNWMVWAAYSGVGLILVIPQYDLSIYIDFFAKFIEISIIVSSAYKNTPFDF
ncbi:MAG: hypothetical protein ACFE9S_00985 [Candidatus Hermodarchaeota archaeon]